jgi:hypothetical protein
MGARFFYSVMVFLLSLTLLAPGAPALAQAPTTDGVSAPPQGSGLVVAWPGPSGDAETALGRLPIVRFQGYELPLQLLTVQTDADVALALQIIQLSTTNWPGALAPAAPMTPPVLDGVSGSGPQEVVALPTTPIFVLRQGKLYGQTIAVIAISPLFQEGSQLKLATIIQAEIPSATMLSGETPALLSAARARAATSVQTAGAASQLAPTNPLAAQSSFKVVVAQAGIQEISGQILEAAGLNLAATDPNRLQLMRQNQPVLLEIEGLVGGRLAPTSTLRFYAPTAGDRWNLTDTYWLTTVPIGGARMAVRPVNPGNATTRTTAIERGVWQANKEYSSNLPGVDGDHWFHRELKLDGVTSAVVSITINNQLPAATGSAYYTVTLSSGSVATFTLQAQLGDTPHPLLWSAQPPNGAWLDNQTVFSLPASVQQVEVKLTQIGSSSPNAAVWFDQMPWEQPAELNFGANGAHFRGVAGIWRYQWQNAPADSQSRYRLYDISNPNAPVALTGASANGFEDGPGIHDYLLAGPGTLYSPQVRPHTPAAFPPTVGAQALYIGPSEFFAALEPLLAHRRNQGYSVMTVDVQQIYDAWSYGQVSAEAIRTFLRYARAAWPQPPLSVVLVGDGTWDPHNYEGRDRYTLYVPPYVAYVDPWLGEAACENCYGQLDGDDPRTGDQPAGVGGTIFGMDLWVGRFPVKSAVELSELVSKIVRYETDSSLGDWRNVTLFLADNYVMRLDNEGKPIYDGAGDFARMSDLMIRRALCAKTNTPAICTFEGANSDHQVADPVLQEQIQQLLAASSLRMPRYYYDPYPQISDQAGVQGWRIPDAAAAKQNVVNAMSWGAGLVVFTGHANHWQWAGLDTDKSLLGLVGLNDPDIFANRDRPFIALSMTCLTAQFHKPANSGTTLDERLLLVRNGAVAVWGPAGLSVVHGHDALQRGFFQALWGGETTGGLRLGELLESGYYELMTRSACCQDALLTFLLLGDPLTPARVMPLDVTHLPIVQK